MLDVARLGLGGQDAGRGGYDRTYISKLIDKGTSGRTDPTTVLTKVEPVADAIEAYKQFDLRRPGWIKVEPKPGS